MAKPQHHRPDLDRCFKHLIILALISALVYLINRWILMPRPGTSVFFRDYLGDILALPVYLPLSLYLSFKLEIVPAAYQLNHFHVLGAVILFSVIFEGIVPLIDASATSDPFDMLAYLFGGFIVYFVDTFCRRELSKP